MVIRIALLFIPEFDEQALEQVRMLLSARLPGYVIMQERSAGNQVNWIEEVLTRWCDEDELDLVLTLGGTLPAQGLSNREAAPLATRRVIERELPGVSESMRAYAGEQTELAYLDCGVAGVRGRTLLINLPATAAAAHLFLEGCISLVRPILAHVNERSDAPYLDQTLEFIDNSEHDIADVEADNLSSEFKAPDRTADRTDQEAGPARASTRELDPAEFEAYLRRQGSS